MNPENERAEVRKDAKRTGCLLLGILGLYALAAGVASLCWLNSVGAMPSVGQVVASIILGAVIGVLIPSLFSIGGTRR